MKIKIKKRTLERNHKNDGEILGIPRMPSSCWSSFLFSWPFCSPADARVTRNTKSTTKKKERKEKEKKNQRKKHEAALLFGAPKKASPTSFDELDYLLKFNSGARTAPRRRGGGLLFFHWLNLF